MNVPDRSKMRDKKITVPNAVAEPLKVEARKMGMTMKALVTLALTQYLNSKGVSV